MKNYFDYKVESCVTSTIQCLQTELQTAIDLGYKPDYIDSLVLCLKALIEVKSYNS